MNDCTTRICTQCKRELPANLEYFNKLSRVKSGLNPRCRDCTSANQLKNRNKNPDRARELDRARYQRDKEKRNEANRIYRLAHREELRAYNKQYRKENEDYLKQKDREYSAAHREEKRIYARTYRVEHRDKWLEGNHEYNRSELGKARDKRKRAKRRGAEGTHTALEIKQQYESQKGLCWWCGKAVGENYHLDHRIPLARGGSNNINNIVISCPSCNTSKQAKLPHEWIGRLL